MKNNIVHQLTQKETGKIIKLKLKGKGLISETGKPEKLKVTEKSFSSLEKAEKNFYKKERDALKKGFILNNVHAKTGEPILHKFIGDLYTGCLSFEFTKKGIYIYKDGKNFSSLVLIDISGKQLEEIILPCSLAWNMECRTETNSLLLDLDHSIFEYNLENNSFSIIENRKNSFESFVSVSENKIVYATNKKVNILDNQNIVLNFMKYEPEIIKGSIPFCGKLSKNGELLALHNKIGEIKIIDTKKWKIINKVEASFEMVEKMEFSNDNNLLMIKEKYGTWKMRYFNFFENKELKIDDLEIPEYTKEVNNFCLNSDQSKLVLIQHTKAYVYDFIRKELLYNFEVEHMVKNCNIKFIGNKLGIRTDYGYFSIYEV